MSKVRILTYHRIGIPRSGRTERLTVPPARFARQIGLMRLMRTRFGNLDETAAWLRGERQPAGRPVVLTFDDGYADLCETAMPLLIERGIPALVYVVAHGRQDAWMDWGAPGPLALMDWNQIRDLARCGIEFGSHSCTHADLTQLAPGDLAAEVGDSKKAIEDQLGRAVRHFCYPYGAHDQRVVAAVRQAGYLTACTTRRGALRADADPFRLPRLTVGKRMNLTRFWLRLNVRH